MTVSEILTIGDELLRGERNDTNSTWLGKFLTEQGAKVIKTTTIGDEIYRISNEIKRIMQGKTELVITTGGLGPTQDDKTLKAIASALDTNLILNEKALNMVKESYAELEDANSDKQIRLTPARRKMAKIPKEATPVYNPAGTAPAVYMEEQTTKIFALPGIPEEMKSIIKNNIDRLELTDKKSEQSSRTFTIVGKGESSLAPTLEKIREKFPTVEVSSYPSIREETPKIRIRISDKKENLHDIENYFQKMIRNLEGAEIEK